MNCSNTTCGKQADAVIPFRGLRYCDSLVNRLAQLVCPPYDIISPEDQQRIHSKDERNAIHLDFGLSFDGDDEKNNRYTRAGDLLARWTDEGVLCLEERPAIYLLQEDFNSRAGAPISRRGLIAAVRLADFEEGWILPHEETAPGPKQDRLSLMKATEANLSSIFCLYSDPAGRIGDKMAAATQLKEPATDFRDENGTRHRLWVIDDKETLATVSGAFSEKTLLIADGHHRYETALAYRDRRRQQNDGEGCRPYDYLMVYLANMDDTSQQVLPIHRLVCGLDPETVEGLPQPLEADFEITKIDALTGSVTAAVLEQMGASREKNAFGLYLPGRDSFYVLVARRARPLLDGSDHGPAWRSLDVAVLDRLVLSDRLGIRKGGPNETARIDFVEDTAAALERSRDCDALFFVNPTTMAEIKAVAEEGEKMPQKSTYFHPKPVTGLVFRSLRSDT